MKQLIAILLCAVCSFVPSAQAGYHGVNVADIAQFEILPGWRTEKGTHITALRVRLAPGWKTYWRAPGDAGIPPRFDWEGSDNLKSVRFLWPAPEVFDQNGMRSVGYKQELVLPIEMTPRQVGEGITVRAEVEIGVCEDICIPVSVKVAADITGAGAADARIRAAINARPDTAKEAGVRSVQCQIAPISDGVRLTAHIQMPKLGAIESAVVEMPDQSIWVAEAVTHRVGSTLTAVTDIVPPANRAFVMDRSQVRITVLSNGRAVDIQGCKG